MKKENEANVDIVTTGILGQDVKKFKIGNKEFGGRLTKAIITMTADGINTVELTLIPEHIKIKGKFKVTPKVER